MTVQIKVYQIILMCLIILCLPKICKILDKKTRCKDDTRKISIKYDALFWFVNIFCFLFLNIIREKRKIDFYNFYVKFYEENEKYFAVIARYPSVSETILNYDKKTHKKIIRYLKIKNLKNK